MDSDLVLREGHWDSYYSEADAPLIPSQFAVFAFGELNGAKTVIDVGSGTGRDSFFFAANGYPVIGIDMSASAINQCVRRKPIGAKLTFIQSAIDDPNLAPMVLKTLREFKASGPVFIYARFLLHAITKKEEAAFFDFAGRAFSEYGGRLALEFRTVRDRDQAKATPDHYRRFIDPLQLIADARDAGLQSSYFVEGFGYAKYRQDDAHVARCIFDYSR